MCETRQKLKITAQKNKKTFGLTKPIIAATTNGRTFYRTTDYIKQLMNVFRQQLIP